jgi:ABC-2 type transport system ATP-binding protein
VVAGLRILPAMASVVELVAARKRFGNVEAVRGVDLTIEPGEVVAMSAPTAPARPRRSA